MVCQNRQERRDLIAPHEVIVAGDERWMGKGRGDGGGPRLGGGSCGGDFLHVCAS